jgi:hypothetical protein
MKREDHELECVQKLGKPFTEVHQFLDQHFATLGAHHRCKLHHEEGIKMVKLQFGEEAAKAARLHILSDLRDEGWNLDLIPRDEEHYKDIGLF